MTDAQVKNSIKDRELKLGRSDRFTHFEIVFWLIFLASIMPALFLYDLIAYGQIKLAAPVSTAIGVFTFIPSILAIIFYSVQKRRLALTEIKTPLTREQLRDLILQLAENKKWEARNNRKTFMIMKTHPSFWSGSWGEQITVLFDDRRVWVNSICDPEQQTSVVSMGRNKNNVATLVSDLSGSRLSVRS